MAKIDLPYQIVNDSPANAAPVQSDFVRIEQHINAELIERGGTVAMAAQLRLVGNPVAPLDAAPKQYVDSIIPVGGILTFGGVAAPPGGVWLMCDGSPYETAVYPQLFAVIGTRYGGSGGFFNVPPMVNRVPVGGGGKYAVGVQGGSSDSIVVPHTHPIDHDHPLFVSGNENQAHNHGGANHAHGVSITSDVDDTNHIHFPDSGGDFLMNGNGSGGDAYVATTAPNPGSYSLGKPAGRSAQHRHAVNGGTGLADRDLTTGNENQAHNHNVDVPNFGGSSGAVAGATTGPAAETNMPPYVGVTFLIRAA